MLNLGFYLEDVGDRDLIYLISQEINKAKTENQLSDASIFYDNIGPLAINVDAGMFNSTDLWDFTGSLVVFSLPSLSKAISYINKYDIYYYFGLQHYNTMQLLDILWKQEIPTIASDNKASNNFFRITNRRTIAVNEELVGITNTILGQRNE
jgi:hypothetical protein